MLRAAALLILFAALLWTAAAARADAPPRPELRQAEPWLTLAAQPRFTLWLTSSRTPCTAGTPTEISWNISGGSAPHHLTIEGEAVDPAADNIRINCGALTEVEAADEEAALAAKRITAVVTDSRGVRREAALEVQRARALSAPIGLNVAPQGTTAFFWWDEVAGTGSQSPPFYRYRGASPQHRRYLFRHQPTGATTWSYELTDNPVMLALPDGERLASVAAIRHPLEAETPDVLAWSAPIDYKNVTRPTNVAVTATHDTVTVSWDVQRHVPEGHVSLIGPDGRVSRGFDSPRSASRESVRFANLPPATNFTVRLKIGWFESNLGLITVPIATEPAPPGYRPLPAGPQRLRLTATHESITATWEPPHADAEPLYYVNIYEELAGWTVARRVVHDGATTWTEYGSFIAIRPATTYRVIVRHGDIRGGTVEATITTSPRRASLQPELRAAEPWLTLAAQPRFTLWLTSSRDLCTAGTLTEISWKISGGAPPHTLSIQGEPTNPAADNIRINCGALTETEAADEETVLAAKRITATVTDSRGVRREATLDVARARALPAPSPQGTSVQRTSMATNWSTIGGAHHGAVIGWWLMRWRPAADSNANWTYTLIEQPRVGDIVIGGFGGLREGSSYAYAVATLRDSIEQATPDALVWSGEFEGTTSTTPTGVRATSTHDTITVNWDEQPSVNYVYVNIIRADGVGRPGGATMSRREATLTDRVTLIDLEPETEYDITVSVDGDVEARLSTAIKAATAAAPADWQAPPRGAQNLQVSATHDTITVTWDAPVPNTYDHWIVRIEHPSRPSAYSRWVSAPLALTLEGLNPETTYEVRVKHLDLYGVEVSTAVTTAAAPSHAGVLPASLESAP